MTLKKNPQAPTLAKHAVENQHELNFNNVQLVTKEDVLHKNNLDIVEYNLTPSTTELTCRIYHTFIIYNKLVRSCHY